MRSWFNINKVVGALYRVDYGNPVTEENSKELVISRAFSMIGRFCYKLLKQNCEHFASYCKTGEATCMQIGYFLRGIKRCFNEMLSKVVIGTALEEVGSIAGKRMVYYATSEVIERAVKGTNLIGAGFIIFIEGVYLIIDLSKFHAQRKSGDVTRNDFIESVITRVTRAIFSAACTIGAGIGGEILGGIAGTLILPGIGTVIGAIIGGAVCSIFGKLVGHVVGNFSGYVISRAALKLLKYDDVAVKKISDLTSGDQIVLYVRLSHPRCHMLVVEHDGVSKIKVIRSTYRCGVVEEWIMFVEPIYKVIYPDNECRSIDETLCKARSKIGTNTYNLLINNCKHFARVCKIKGQ